MTVLGEYLDLPTLTKQSAQLAADQVVFRISDEKFEKKLEI